MKLAKKPMPEGLDEQSERAALLRAAKRAHFIAYQHRENLVLGENGKTVFVPPDPAMYGELLAKQETQKKSGKNSK